MHNYLSWGHDEVASLLQKSNGWHDERRGALGASDATVLMNGEPNAILDLWRIKRGEQEPEDLSGVLPVVLGTISEPLNRYMFTRSTGRPVSRVGGKLKHERYGFMACTLDGLTTTASGQPAVFEAKHVNAFSKIDDIKQRYLPQIHHCMFVCGLSHAILSVFIGTLTHEIVEVEQDDWFLAQLIDREREFWRCVQSGEPPAEMPAVAAPVSPGQWRTVSMQGSNEWASSAADWLEHRDAAKKFTASEKAIKALMEADVGHAHGHGIECKRAKNNSLRISAAKE